MGTSNAAHAAVKTVGDPNAAYESARDLWKKSRALCSGERYVKELDAFVDPNMFTNLLIPFSPSMTQAQYNFYKAEAELPGITAQFAKMLVGGLLRKKPTLILPKDAPEGAQDWIMNQFGRDDSSLISFMDSVLWEEIQTSRSWVFVDYPAVKNPEDLTKDEKAELKPYPTIWKGEFVINWRTRANSSGKHVLDRIITRGMVETFEDDKFHPEYVETVWVHELVDDKYQIRVFERKETTSEVQMINGVQVTKSSTDGVMYELKDTITDILVNGEHLNFIPAWPVNGSIDIVEPILMPIIDKEVALYNKISRRNHLLYGAATYTPVVYSDMLDTEFDTIVSAGLGTWIKVGQEDKVDVLKTPTEALKDMEATIAASIEEMAKLGIRMLTPETDQSGVALQLRNAAQTAQLGTLNGKVSSQFTQIIAFMLNWRYGKEYTAADVEFSMSTDFNPMPLGADWLRLCTEWYEGGLIPRSIWLEILKHNDMVSPDYDDEKGKQEIVQDKDLLVSKEDLEYADKLRQKMDKADGKDQKFEP